ncbi:carboxypeptidase regulatory-like domain-containing protein [Micromonosporaceae bacterium DT55]|uniref:carboxypeptidase regulatory-like domain-containing protein n=1 Tax=Melissospora conviva TaxID=3388432 RepID=UPI003C21B882
MSTHRSWKQRAGVVAALIAGALLAAPATPALAAEPTVNITGPTTVTSGGKVQLTYSVTAPADDQDPPGQVPVPMPVPRVNVDIGVNVPSGWSCSGACGQPEELTPGEPKSFSVTLTAPSVGSGKTARGDIRITANGGSATHRITVKGPEVQTVGGIAGKVTDIATGAGVPGAMVMLLDSAGNNYETGTNDSGNFSFRGSRSNPIAPGPIEIGASHDGKTKSTTINGANGQNVTGVILAMQVAPSPSPTPSASPTPATDDEEEEFSAEPTQAVPTNDQAAAESSGGGFSLGMIVVGGLFVALGVGTIVLLLMRRKNGEDDADEDDDPKNGGAGGGAAAVPGSRGAYNGLDDKTRIVRPAPVADATMVGGTSLADAPTMMHSRPLVEDEFPDPYGAPLPPVQHQGYGQQARGAWGEEEYGSGPASGSGYSSTPASGAGYGDSPASGGGYSSPAPGGYGDRGDEPTGRYGPNTEIYGPAADPYATGLQEPAGQSGRGYGQEPGGYGRPTASPEPEPGYDNPEPGYGRGGYGAEKDYGSPAGGAYGTGQGGAYGSTTPQGGYGERGGYGEAESGGYGSPQRGYGDDYGSPAPQPGGYDPAPQPGGYDPAPSAGGYDPAPAAGYDTAAPSRGYGEPVGYEQRAEGYGSPAGYDQRGGYSEPTGYDPRGGYDPAAPQRGYGEPTGYDPAPPARGYGEPAGYGPRGYDPAPPQGGYDPVPPQGGYDPVPPQGGYGETGAPQRPGGYDEPGYYGSAPQGERARPDVPGQPQDRSRRSLDWLDD